MCVDSLTHHTSHWCQRCTGTMKITSCELMLRCNWDRLMKQLIDNKLSSTVEIKKNKGFTHSLGSWMELSVHQEQPSWQSWQADGYWTFWSCEMQSPDRNALFRCTMSKKHKCCPLVCDQQEKHFLPDVVVTDVMVPVACNLPPWWWGPKQRSIYVLPWCSCREYGKDTLEWSIGTGWKCFVLHGAL